MRLIETLRRHCKYPIGSRTLDIARLQVKIILASLIHVASFKNQKTRGVSAMHPRNTFSKDYPVFHKLARQYPDLKKQ